MSYRSMQPTSYQVVKEVKYDHQYLKIGEKVERIGEWRETTVNAGYHIATFKRRSGGSIPLLSDEVKPTQQGEAVKEH